MQSRITWRGGAATKPELILQEAAEGTEELICPLITRISADGEPRPTPESGFTEGRRGSGEMTSAVNRCSDSEN
jgi:hypothetical protein